MTKEQDKAIERCNKLIETEHSNWIGINNQKAIETVLNMLKENSAEIHQKNTELAEKNAEIEKYKQLYNKALDDAVITAHDNMKKDKMIDLYIDELVTNEFDRCCQERCRECEKDKDTLRTCIKQYFERKVEK